MRDRIEGEYPQYPKWADVSTRRGRIEEAIDPIISGGASQDSINAVIDKIEAMLGETRGD